MEKRSYLLSVIAMFLLILMYVPEAYAESKEKYQVDVDQLNVRTAPNTQAKVIGQLKQGSQVTVFQEKYGWLQTYLNGQEVWVASQYLFKTDNKQVSNVKNDISITGDAVHIRKGPGTDYAILEIAQTGDSYRLIDTKNDWHKIELENNKVAWVASWLTNQPTASGKNQSSSLQQAPTEGKVATKSNSSGQALAGFNIMLDASHGGKDPGAIGIQGVKEKDIALQITEKVAGKLRDAGANVLLTRSNDTFVPLEDRVQMSDNYWTHAFISLHFNAYTSNSSNGISTHYYSSEADFQLAQHIQQALTKHTSLQDRGVRQDNYYVLRKNSAVSVLAELGFITNLNDFETINNTQYASEVAEAILEGLNNYFHQ